MLLIFGLGNPGRKYAGSRHNIGFELIDNLANQLSVSLSSGKGSYQIGKSHLRDINEKVYLIKPTTYMNNSGKAVREAVQWFNADTNDCLVCYDDLALDVGSIRLRPGGSAGGHNGIKDIIQQLGTDTFSRLRIGIGNDFPDGQQVDHVLSSFSNDEQKTINNSLEQAADAALCFARKGIDKAMNNYN